MISLMDYKKLRIWKEGIQLCKEIYLITQNFPSSEKFGLISQMNRSVISVPSNIAEGYGRNSAQELKRFCNISRGSLNELETQLFIAQELKYIKKESTEKIFGDINSLMKQIRSFQQKV